MNLIRQELMIMALSMALLTVCAIPFRISHKRALDLEDKSTKRVQEISPQSSVITELDNDLAKLSGRHSSQENNWKGYKRSGQRCATGFFYQCWRKSSGRRRNVLPY